MAHDIDEIQLGERMSLSRWHFWKAYNADKVDWWLDNHQKLNYPNWDNNCWSDFDVRCRQHIKHAWRCSITNTTITSIRVESRCLDVSFLFACAFSFFFLLHSRSLVPFVWHNDLQITIYIIWNSMPFIVNWFWSILMSSISYIAKKCGAFSAYQINSARTRWLCQNTTSSVIDLDPLYTNAAT